MEKNKPFLLYHWSPTKNRKQITKYGLRPNQASNTEPKWKSPHVCFSTSPSHAWGLSAMILGIEQEYDLWMVWSTNIPDLKRRPDFPKDANVAEFRTAKRVFKSNLWLVGTRQYTKGKRQ